MRVGIFLNEEERRGKELAIQIGIADVLSRARWATGRPVNAVEVTLRQRAPRRRTFFADLLGTTRLTFGADVDSVRLRSDDLSLPLRTGDPVLATILNRYAASLPQVQERPTTWPEHVQQTMAVAFAEGDVSLDSVARRLAMSARTLQRRLAEAGTTWRRELENARRQRLDRLTGLPGIPTHRAAELLGYSDPRALRRAQRRWGERRKGDLL
ncbi:hypothetical protein [Streptomyces sp. NPDC088350]|uniref:hypothetical protein n=1 Tax=Streptomyces sp. NPDC088350 TaxID=3365854 RepID=UPI003810EED6